MSRPVRIEDSTFQRLQQWSVPLDDTPGAVIDRLARLGELVALSNGYTPSPGALTKLFGIFGQRAEPAGSLSRGEPESDGAANGGGHMDANKAVRHAHGAVKGFLAPPSLLRIGATEYPIHFWYDLPCRAVQYASDKGVLRSHIPIKTRRAHRFFVNDKPVHWDGEPFSQPKQVAGVFVEAKYNRKDLELAMNHILQVCGIREPVELVD